MAANKRAGKKSLAQNDFLQPSAPINVVATDVGTNRAFDNGAFSVAFSLPAGSPAATSYTVTATAAGQTTRTATGASSPLVVQTLKSATEYAVTVTATNAVGTSAASIAVNQTATTVPSVPTSVTASAQSGTNSDTVSWTAPANGGKAITNYRWTSSDGKAGDTTSTSVSVGQEAGSAQTYNVYATNANGNSTTSANTASVTSYYNYNNFYNFYNYSNFYFVAFSFSCVAKNTEVATVDENKEIIFVPAKDLKVGMNVLSPTWEEYDFNKNPDLEKVEYQTLTNKGVKVGVIDSIESKISNATVIINNDTSKHYSPTHPILARKSGSPDSWEQIKDLSIGDIFWEYDFESSSYAETELKSITLSNSEDEVYLIGVEGIDTFIAGNIICHK